MERKGVVALGAADCIMVKKICFREKSGGIGHEKSIQDDGRVFNAAYSREF